MRVLEKDAQKVFGLGDNGVQSLQPLKYIENDFEEKGKVVIDHATGLMWQQAGSDKKLTYQQTQAYIEKLNCEQFAGYDNWRLPTMEELLSLLEPEVQEDVTKKSFGYCISPVFDSHSEKYWSADKYRFLSDGWWLVNFGQCIVDWGFPDTTFASVRGVRSM